MLFQQSNRQPMYQLPRIPAVQHDNATSGAAQRSTRQAQATLDARSTLDVQSTATAWASETAWAQKNATATVVARVTGEAVVAAKSAWKMVIHETFQNNALLWPLGVTTDSSPVVTANIADGSYQWAVVVPEGNTYINLLPKNVPAFSAFYASVTVQFATSNPADQTSYGLVFRSMDRDYGFFGVSQSGSFRILNVEGGGIVRLEDGSSPLIDPRPGKPNRISVVGIGPDFVFLINNQVVAQMRAQLSPGKIGLGIEALNQELQQVNVNFSDFRVDAP